MKASLRLPLHLEFANRIHFLSLRKVSFFCQLENETKNIKNLQMNKFFIETKIKKEILTSDNYHKTSKFCTKTQIKKFKNLQEKSKHSKFCPDCKINLVGGFNV